MNTLIYIHMLRANKKRGLVEPDMGQIVLLVGIADCVTVVCALGIHWFLTR